jgi:hypothetical protein
MVPDEICKYTGSLYMDISEFYAGIRFSASHHRKISRWVSLPLMDAGFGNALHLE